jgi:hypothetical protein
MLENDGERIRISDKAKKIIEMQKADPEFFLYQVILSAFQKSKDANVIKH